MKPAQIRFPRSPTASVLGAALVRGVRAAGCFLVFAIVVAFASAPPARAAAGPRTAPPGESVIAQRVAILRGVRDVFRATAASPLPPGLPAAEAAEARRYVAWLQAWAARLDELAAKGESASPSAKGPDQSSAAARHIEEMQMSFNLQYLQLQEKMQNENRQFTMVSNIMKSKHDTAKNSINNIR